MQNIHSKYWDLIAKELANETSLSEKDDLNQWRSQSPENEEQFLQAQADWESLTQTESFSAIDIEKAWAKQLDIIVPSKSKNEPVLYTLQNKTWFRVAAAFILAFTLGISLYLFRSSESVLTEKINTAEDGKPLLVQLPDGSKVYLNKNAKIIYPEEFENTRSVTLLGEAFFEVTPDPQKPFIIKAGEARVRVLGTSFNVLSKEKSKDVEVFVETGKVQLYKEKESDNALVLIPGNIGKLEDNKLLKQNINNNANYLSWKTRQLVFDNTPMEEVSSVLERVYHIDITCDNDAVKNYRLSSTFSNQDLDFVLTVICTTLNLQIKEQSANRVILEEASN